jgi:SAM-dependent methyltransferase
VVVAANSFALPAADRDDPSVHHLSRVEDRRMSDEREFSYDPIADAYAAGVETAPYNALYERPAMLAMLPPVEGLRVLDAGCGSGLHAAALLDRGARVTGIDASTAMVEHARRRLAGCEVELRVADLRAPLPFADGGFDGIMSALVLHYLRDWVPTLAEFRRVLRPGGWLVFSTHHPASDAMLFNPARYLEVEEVEDEWDRVGTVRFYRRPLSRIINDLMDAGFVIERLEEPIPVDAFREAKPEAYARILRQPGFLLIRARSREGASSS